MTERVLTVQTLFDYGATFVWALSGALIAARRGYDVFGLTIVALVSATGGGLLRDGLFLQNGPPALARTPDYLLIVVAVVLLVRAIGGWLNELSLLPPVIQIVDALAIGAYAVVGMRLALEARLSLPAVGLVGVINAIGGSLLRDVLMRREPELFKPGTLMTLAVLASTILYLIADLGLGLSPFSAAFFAVIAAALIRGVSVRYDLRTRAVPGFEEGGQTEESSGGV
jgi:uncharacterized membrane protein YeiH